MTLNSVSLFHGQIRKVLGIKTVDRCRHMASLAGALETVSPDEIYVAAPALKDATRMIFYRKRHEIEITDLQESVHYKLSCKFLYFV